MDNGNPKLIASVKKAFDVLDVLIFEDAQGRGMRLNALSERVGIKPNTLHGILQTIVACGYAEQDSRARYHMGKRCRQIGIVNRFRITPETAGKLNHALGRLCDETGESVSFYVLDGGDRIVYANFSSKDIIKVDYTMLEENSMYGYPSGRILVAHATESELDEILQKHGFPGDRWNGICTRSALDAELKQTRDTGLLSRRSADGVASFAVPVFWEGKLLGSVGVYLPSYRCTEEKERLIRERLLRFSDELPSVEYSPAEES